MLPVELGHLGPHAGSLLPGVKWKKSAPGEYFLDHRPDRAVVISHSRPSREVIGFCIRHVFGCRAGVTMEDTKVTASGYDFSPAHAAMRRYVDEHMLSGVSTAVLVGRDLVDVGRSRVGRSFDWQR
jgi:hypothetical protein